MTFLELPGLTDAETGALLLFLTLMLWGLYQGWMGVAFAGLLGTITASVGSFADWADFEVWILLSLVLVLIGAWFEVFVNYEEWVLVKRMTGKKRA